MPLIQFLLSLVAATAALSSWGQAPDTVFIRQDKLHDDTLIYVSDTIVFESGMRKQILIGTTILPYTHNQMVAMGEGVYLEKITKSDCQMDAYDKMAEDKIHSVIQTDTTLTVDITINDNCCYEFLCDASVDSTGVLNLMSIGYGTHCSCECCFGLTYHFDYYKSQDTTPLRAVMINGNRKTLKPIKQ